MSESHPLIFAKPHVLLRLFVTNKNLGFLYSLKIIFLFFLSLLNTPIRLLDSLFFTKKVENTLVHESPLFVLGHWRSGTTFLQTLLSKDTQFGFLNGYQAFMPGLEFVNSKLIYKILDLAVPKKRQMDNMPRGLTIPEEEEFALTATTNMGSYNSLWFPKNETYFYKFNLFEGINSQELNLWKKSYTNLLKRVSLYTGKPRLVLKNPPNTARIKVLLEIYPKAKFINIHRNPYDVYMSMKNMYNKSIAPHFLQKMSKEDVHEKIMQWYEKLMKKYIQEVNLIPQAQFYDIKYEEFILNPLKKLEQAYSTLNLDYSLVKDEFQKHLDSVANYKKNSFEMDNTTLEDINKRWAFSFLYFGYEMRSSNSV